MNVDKGFLQLIAGTLRALTLFTRFALIFLLARILPPAEFGLFGLYFAGLQLATSFVGVDLYTYTTKQLTSKGANRSDLIAKHFGAIIILLLLLSPVFASAFLVSNGAITGYIAVIFLMHLILEAISAEGGRILVPLGRPLAADIILFVRSSLWVIPLIVAYFVSPLQIDLIYVLLLWVSGSILASICTVRFIGGYFDQEKYTTIDFKWIHTAFFGSIIFLAGTLLFRSILGLDRFVVSWLLGLEVVGVYGLYASVCLGVLGLIESSVSAWHFPALIREIQLNDKAEIRKRFLAFFRQNSIASVSIISFVVIVFPPLADYLLSEIYVKNIGAFYFIAAGVFFYCLSMPFHYVIFGYRRDVAFVLIYGAAMIVGALFAVAFIPTLGPIGAGIMLGLALFVVSVGRVIFAAFLFRKANSC
ncbi:MAG: oligosaccharide flippase family protein [Burkholderiaceae bacterium]|nr:oligosaccharide flippase family protein [Burkholderiaceae bacterium]